jgi:hypothetical protein
MSTKKKKATTKKKPAARKPAAGNKQLQELLGCVQQLESATVGLVDDCRKMWIAIKDHNHLHNHPETMEAVNGFRNRVSSLENRVTEIAMMNRDHGRDIRNFSGRIVKLESEAHNMLTSHEEKAYRNGYNAAMADGGKMLPAAR